MDGGGIGWRNARDRSGVFAASRPPRSSAASKAGVQAAAGTSASPAGSASRGSGGGVTERRRGRFGRYVVAAGAGVAVAGGGDDSSEPITGPALEQASAAALAYTGGGRVTETEVGDEESYYEVEVTRADGSQVDVQLDRGFQVVGQKADHEDGG